MKLNVGCGPHYAEGWLNLDVHRGDGVEPDIVVAPFDMGRHERGARWLPVDYCAEEVYLGHVLEHLPWAHVIGVLQEMRRVLADGGEMCVVGPDTRKALELWKADSPWVPREILDACLEDDSAYMLSDGKVAGWEGARHQWNCYEDRVAAALRHAGFSVVHLEPTDPDLDDYPVVSRAPWQFFLLAHAA